MKNTNDIAYLVQRVQSGDSLAAELLYERFASAMYLLSMRITNDRMQSEDVLQEAFVQSFTKIKDLKDARRYGAWLKQIVVRKSIRAIQKRQQWENLEDHPIEDIPIATEAITGIELEKIHQAIAELPEKSRVVFSLHLLEGYTHVEISDFLNIAVSTSKSQYRYALKLLRNKLESVK